MSFYVQEKLQTGRGVGKVCCLKKACVGDGRELECPLNDMLGI